jgi:hypothetical protein
MKYLVVILALFTTLALAQTTSMSRSDVPSEQPEHHRHDDDDEPPPASASSVLPDSPVITIEGLCDHVPDAAIPSGGAEGRGSSATSAAVSPAAAANSACQTIVTKAQFEELVDAVNPGMSGPVRRQLAESYPRLLLFAHEARELGLDQDPRFAEMMRFASIQLLTQRLTQYFEQQASHISDSDIEKYYKENAIKFERAELLRIFVPKQSRQTQKTASRKQSNMATDASMLTLAERIQARAAAGEDFRQLQKEAFEATGVSSGSPNVSTGKIGATGLPINHQKVFEMEPGQVSEVIADSSGYYVYKVVSKQMVPVSQASKEIRKSIASQRVQDSVALLTKSLKPELNQMYFGTLPRPQRAPRQQVPESREEPSTK